VSAPVLAAVIPSTRRISAGIVPDPGAASRLPAWWSRQDWLADVSLTAAARPELLRAHHVSLDAVVACARGMAAYADHRDGRNCRPTNARLLVATRYSLSVVQRARRVLKALGFVVELVAGRSIMTRAERLAAWRRGSAHRNVAATFALTSRSPRLHVVGERRAPKERAAKLRRRAQSQGADLRTVDGDTPPGALRVSTPPQLRRSLLRRQTENEEGGSAARSLAVQRPAQARRLAEGVRDRLGWLHGQSWRRLAPTLARFARAGWSPEDVALAVADVLATRGHRVPRELRHPAAYLAGVLRDLEPAAVVRPTVEAAAYEAHLAEQRAAERAARRAHVLAVAGKCPHGVPAAGAGQPSRGVPACLDCRREAQS
jgi:hypothetical protein